MRFSSYLITLFLTFASAALSEERIALVIGNSQYASVEQLDNATHDAVLISDSLRAVGFEVTLIQNSSRIELTRAIAHFGRTLRASGPETVGLFYYAGHGVQSFGSNYLLPIDANLTDAADLDLVALEASSVLRQMASARNQTNIVILDACRNNPFQDIPDMNDSGLAEMKAPTGTYLAYATSPGAVAFDGLGRNSPFTLALAEAMQTEDAPIEAVFKDVRVQVLETTHGAQTPWDTSSLTRDFVFRPGRQLTASEVAEQQLWNSVKEMADPVQIMLFLRAYPDGNLAEEARELLAKEMENELNNSDASAVAAFETETAQEPAPTATERGTTDPKDLEVELMETARASGSKEDYQAYLEAFPEGVFSELVRIEIAGITARETEASQTQMTALPSQPEVESTQENSGKASPVFFDKPLDDGAPEIVGKTIMEVADGSPLYPPIDGLPAEMWKDQKCNNCHQWTRETLCDQAKTYVAQNTSRALQKKHPFGGSFKTNLKNWAQGDCQ